MHDEGSLNHKVQAMIDRAKNKAQEEDDKGVFNVTRKLLADAKQAAGHIKASEREEFIKTINEVLTYCRMQTDAKKAAAKGANKSPQISPREGNNNNVVVSKNGAAKVVAKEPEAPKSSVKVAAPAATKSGATSAGANKGVDAAKKTGTGAKLNNPDVMVRKASMMVAQKKPAAATATVPSSAGGVAKKSTTAAGSAVAVAAGSGGGGAAKKGTAMSEKERVVAALAAKKVVSKVGKLQKEGGGKSLLGRKTWKERLFELSESSLEYYEKSNTTEKPLGTISLHEVSTARSCTVANKTYCFEVVTTERALQIQAQSEADKEEWIRAIQNNVDRLKLQKKIKTLK
jgi:hypothetical protein